MKRKITKTNKRLFIAPKKSTQSHPRIRQVTRHMGRARRRMPHIFLNTVLDTKRKTLKQNKKKKRVRRKKKSQQNRRYSMNYRRETIDP